ncbi:unnamed protein product, partial [Choristocarpus tenellus]
ETFPTLVGVIFKNFDKNFFLHHNTSGWQARHYKQSIARLRPGQAVLVVDFQSQYSHGHQDLTQQEFFNLFLTAVFPAAVWMKDFRRGGHGGGRTWAHSFVFLSQDTSQDNEFVQHVLEKLINEFLKPMAREYGQELRVLHIWTDECGSQFKNRWQMEWVSKAFGRHEIAVIHNFFASFHGKSLSDAIGAVVKPNARLLERNGVRMPGTSSLVETLKASSTDFCLTLPTPEENEQLWKE